MAEEEVQVVVSSSPELDDQFQGAISTLEGLLSKVKLDRDEHLLYLM